eukprot:4027841-Pleurochrysis_carterae.AAC.1
MRCARQTHSHALCARTHAQTGSHAHAQSASSSALQHRRVVVSALLNGTLCAADVGRVVGNGDVELLAALVDTQARGGERDRETEAETEAETERLRGREAQTETEAGKNRDRDTDREIGTEAVSGTEIET